MVLGGTIYSAMDGSGGPILGGTAYSMTNPFRNTNISFSPAGHPVPIYVIQPLTSPGTPNCTHANVASDSDCHVSIPGRN